MNKLWRFARAIKADAAAKMRLCSRPNCMEPACQQVGGSKYGKLCKAHAAAMRKRSQKDKALPKCKICGGGSVAKKGSDFCSRHQPFVIDSMFFDEMSPIDPEHIDEILKVIAADYNVPVWRLRGESSPKSSTPEPGQYKIWFGPQYGAPGRWALCNCDRHGVWSSESGMYMPEPNPSQFENNGG